MHLAYSLTDSLTSSHMDYRYFMLVAQKKQPRTLRGHQESGKLLTASFVLFEKIEFGLNAL